MKVTLVLLSSVALTLALNYSDSHLRAFLLEDYDGSCLPEGQRPSINLGVMAPQRQNSGYSRSALLSKDDSLKNTPPPQIQGVQADTGSAPHPIDSGVVERARVGFPGLGGEGVVTGSRPLQAKPRALNPVKCVRDDDRLAPSPLRSYAGAENNQLQPPINAEMRQSSSPDEQDNEDELLSGYASIDPEENLTNYNCDSQSTASESVSVTVLSHSQENEASLSQSFPRADNPVDRFNRGSSGRSSSLEDYGYGDQGERYPSILTTDLPEFPSYDSYSQAGSGYTWAEKICNDSECYYGVSEEKFE